MNKRPVREVDFVEKVPDSSEMFSFGRTPVFWIGLEKSHETVQPGALASRWSVPGSTPNSPTDSPWSSRGYKPAGTIPAISDQLLDNAVVPAEVTAQASTTVSTSTTIDSTASFTTTTTTTYTTTFPRLLRRILFSTSVENDNEASGVDEFTSGGVSPSALFEEGGGGISSADKGFTSGGVNPSAHFEVGGRGASSVVDGSTSGKFNPSVHTEQQVAVTALHRSTSWTLLDEHGNETTPAEEHQSEVATSDRPVVSDGAHEEQQQVSIFHASTWKIFGRGKKNKTSSETQSQSRPDSGSDQVVLSGGSSAVQEGHTARNYSIMVSSSTQVDLAVCNAESSGPLSKSAAGSSSNQSTLPVGLGTEQGGSADVDQSLLVSCVGMSDQDVENRTSSSQGQRRTTTVDSEELQFSSGRLSEQYGDAAAACLSPSKPYVKDGGEKSEAKVTSMSVSKHQVESEGVTVLQASQGLPGTSVGVAANVPAVKYGKGVVTPPPPSPPPADLPPDSLSHRGFFMWREQAPPHPHAKPPPPPPPPRDDENIPSHRGPLLPVAITRIPPRATSWIALCSCHHTHRPPPPPPPPPPPFLPQHQASLATPGGGLFMYTHRDAPTPAVREPETRVAGEVTFIPSPHEASMVTPGGGGFFVYTHELTPLATDEADSVSGEEHEETGKNQKAVDEYVKYRKAMQSLEKGDGSSRKGTSHSTGVQSTPTDSNIQESSRKTLVAGEMVEEATLKFSGQGSARKGTSHSTGVQSTPTDATVQESSRKTLVAGEMVEEATLKSSGLELVAGGLHVDTAETSGQTMRETAVTSRSEVTIEKAVIVPPSPPPATLHPSTLSHLGFHLWREAAPPQVRTAPDSLSSIFQTPRTASWIALCTCGTTHRPPPLPPPPAPTQHQASLATPLSGLYRYTQQLVPAERPRPLTDTQVTTKTIQKQKGEDLPASLGETQPSTAEVNVEQLGSERVPTLDVCSVPPKEPGSLLVSKQCGEAHSAKGYLSIDGSPQTTVLTERVSDKKTQVEEYLFVETTHLEDVSIHPGQFEVEISSRVISEGHISEGLLVEATRHFNISSSSKSADQVTKIDKEQVHNETYVVDQLKDTDMDESGSQFVSKSLVEPCVEEPDLSAVQTAVHPAEICDTLETDIALEAIEFPSASAILTSTVASGFLELSEVAQCKRKEGAQDMASDDGESLLAKAGKTTSFSTGEVNAREIESNHRKGNAAVGITIAIVTAVAESLDSGTNLRDQLSVVPADSDGLDKPQSNVIVIDHDEGLELQGHASRASSVHLDVDVEASQDSMRTPFAADVHKEKMVTDITYDRSGGEAEESLSRTELKKHTQSIMEVKSDASHNSLQISEFVEYHQSHEEPAEYHRSHDEPVEYHLSHDQQRLEASAVCATEQVGVAISTSVDAIGKTIKSVHWDEVVVEIDSATHALLKQADFQARGVSISRGGQIVDDTLFTQTRDALQVLDHEGRFVSEELTHVKHEIDVESNSEMISNELKNVSTKMVCPEKCDTVEQTLRDTLNSSGQLLNEPISTVTVDTLQYVDQDRKIVTEGIIFNAHTRSQENNTDKWSCEFKGVAANTVATDTGDVLSERQNDSLSSSTQVVNEATLILDVLQFLEHERRFISEELTHYVFVTRQASISDSKPQDVTNASVEKKSSEKDHFVGQIHRDVLILSSNVVDEAETSISLAILKFLDHERRFISEELMHYPCGALEESSSTIQTIKFMDDPTTTVCLEAETSHVLEQSQGDSSLSSDQIVHETLSTLTLLVLQFLDHERRFMSEELMYDEYVRRQNIISCSKTQDFKDVSVKIVSTDEVHGMGKIQRDALISSNQIVDEAEPSLTLVLLQFLDHERRFITEELMHSTCRAKQEGCSDLKYDETKDDFLETLTQEKVDVSGQMQNITNQLSADSTLVTDVSVTDDCCHHHCHHQDQGTLPSTLEADPHSSSSLTASLPDNEKPESQLHANGDSSTTALSVKEHKDISSPVDDENVPQLQLTVAKDTIESSAMAHVAVTPIMSIPSTILAVAEHNATTLAVEVGEDMLIRPVVDKEVQELQNTVTKEILESSKFGTGVAVTPIHSGHPTTLAVEDHDAATLAVEVEENILTSTIDDEKVQQQQLTVPDDTLESSTVVSVAVTPILSEHTTTLAVEEHGAATLTVEVEENILTSPIVDEKVQQQQLTVPQDALESSTVGSVAVTPILSEHTTMAVEEHGAATLTVEVEENILTSPTVDEKVQQQLTVPEDTLVSSTVGSVAVTPIHSEHTTTLAVEEHGAATLAVEVEENILTSTIDDEKVQQQQLTVPDDTLESSTVGSVAVTPVQCVHATTLTVEVDEDNLSSLVVDDEVQQLQLSVTKDILESSTVGSVEITPAHSVHSTASAVEGDNAITLIVKVGEDNLSSSTVDMKEKEMQNTVIKEMLESSTDGTGVALTPLHSEHDTTLTVEVDEHIQTPSVFDEKEQLQLTLTKDTLESSAVDRVAITPIHSVCVRGAQHIQQVLEKEIVNSTLSVEELEIEEESPIVDDEIQKPHDRVVECTHDTVIIDQTTASTSELAPSLRADQSLSIVGKVTVSSSITVREEDDNVALPVGKECDEKRRPKVSPAEDQSRIGLVDEHRDDIVADMAVEDKELLLLHPELATGPHIAVEDNEQTYTSTLLLRFSKPSVVDKNASRRSTGVLSASRRHLTAERSATCSGAVADVQSSHREPETHGVVFFQESIPGLHHRANTPLPCQTHQHKDPEASSSSLSPSLTPLEPPASYKQSPTSSPGEPHVAAPTMDVTPASSLLTQQPLMDKDIPDSTVTECAVQPNQSVSGESSHETQPNVDHECIEITIVLAKREGNVTFLDKGAIGDADLTHDVDIVESGVNDRVELSVDHVPAVVTHDSLSLVSQENVGSVLNSGGSAVTVKEDCNIGSLLTQAKHTLDSIIESHVMSSVQSTSDFKEQEPLLDMETDNSFLTHGSQQHLAAALRFVEKNPNFEITQITGNLCSNMERQEATRILLLREGETSDLQQDTIETSFSLSKEENVTLAQLDKEIQQQKVVDVADVRDSIMIENVNLPIQPASDVEVVKSLDLIEKEGVDSALHVQVHEHMTSRNTRGKDVVYSVKTGGDVHVSSTQSILCSGAREPHHLEEKDSGDFTLTVEIHEDIITSPRDQFKEVVQSATTGYGVPCVHSSSDLGTSQFPHIMQVKGTVDSSLFIKEEHDKHASTAKEAIIEESEVTLVQDFVPDYQDLTVIEYPEPRTDQMPHGSDQRYRLPMQDEIVQYLDTTLVVRVVEREESVISPIVTECEETALETPFVDELGPAMSGHVEASADLRVQHAMDGNILVSSSSMEEQDRNLALVMAREDIGAHGMGFSSEQEGFTTQEVMSLRGVEVQRLLSALADDSHPSVASGEEQGGGVLCKVQGAVNTGPTLSTCPLPEEFDSAESYTSNLLVRLHGGRRASTEHTGSLSLEEQLSLVFPLGRRTTPGIQSRTAPPLPRPRPRLREPGVCQSSPPPSSGLPRPPAACELLSLPPPPEGVAGPPPHSGEPPTPPPLPRPRYDRRDHPQLGKPHRRL